MKSNQLKNKIDTLLISIEALDIYSSEYISKKEFNISYNEKIVISKIRFGNYNRHPKYNKQCEFEDSIKAIYSINNSMTNLYIQNTIEIILNNYSNNLLCNLTQQYIKRYIYIYIKTQNHYNNLSNCINTKIKDIAISNLYILNKINTNDGIYKLIRYLNL